MKEVNYIYYNAGNYMSLINSLNEINFKAHIIKDPKDIVQNLPIIIPGVGNFGYCIQQFKKTGFYDYFKNNSNIKANVIGICVGMQIMFEKSEEASNNIGLGIFDGEIVNLKKAGIKKTPSVGWFKTYQKNQLYGKYYYIHSFGNIDNNEDRFYYKNNNIKITSLIKKNNYIGFQFHPEKSGEEGLKILNEYLQK